MISEATFLELAVHITCFEVSAIYVMATQFLEQQLNCYKVCSRIMMNRVALGHHSSSPKQNLLWPRLGVEL